MKPRRVLGTVRSSTIDLVQVLLEDAVLLPQVLDDLKLVAIHPARKGHDQDPQRDGVEHVPSLSVWACFARLSLRPTFRIVRDIVAEQTDDRHWTRLLQATSD
jgi:hypothetical protein